MEQKEKENKLKKEINEFYADLVKYLANKIYQSLLSAIEKEK